jgi:hypothetical protein
VPTMVVGKEHGCAVAAAMAETAIVGSAGDCPNTTVEVSAAILWVGYTLVVL